MSFKVLASGFIAEGDTNQSDGRGPSYEIGRYDTLDEAVDAARGKGVQGDPGSIYLFELRFEDGAKDTYTYRVKIQGRPSMEFAKGDYSVGWLNPNGSRCESRPPL